MQKLKSTKLRCTPTYKTLCQADCDIAIPLTDTPDPQQTS